MSDDYIAMWAGELKLLVDKQNIRSLSYRTERIHRLMERIGVPVVLLEVEEIAAGDFSPEYGTVTVAQDTGAAIHLEFINGTILDLTKGTEMEIDQGGRFDHGRGRPDPGK